MVEVLLPDVLQALPLTVSQAIRDFSKQYKSWLMYALEGLPAELQEKKMSVAREFSHELCKLGCINHVAQNCRKVLQSSAHLTQMLVDWNRIDFSFINNQPAWMCRTGTGIVQNIQDNFRRFLQQRLTIEQWAQWLRDTAERFLAKCADMDHLTMASQELLLKWSFYSSLIIRDLSIRSAPSLGSFHLMRTLLDTYLAYIVERRLTAAANGTLPMSPYVEQEEHLSGYNRPAYSSLIPEETIMQSTPVRGSEPPTKQIKKEVNSFPSSQHYSPSIETLSPFSHGGPPRGAEFVGESMGSPYGSIHTPRAPYTAKEPPLGPPARKFGSFGMFSSEFSKSFRNSFDRGSTQWPQLFHTLSAPLNSGEREAVDQPDPGPAPTTTSSAPEPNAGNVPEQQQQDDTHTQQP
eukprot:CAMPEP_0174258474 /NCGR_PEP_ID=MMETSP0439-20130205/7456_1 /TAXON_ID=0 /ORGANISM="Stereomyxa ramosa, Strain Chinc5" /LENGTH=405 /DNA_ID=CAMNT_0015341993 /DNA_START=889 /DNA_END=2106 /DNA_ORIENTATION=+